jgi:AraC-like DNA-binding protein
MQAAHFTTVPRERVTIFRPWGAGTAEVWEVSHSTRLWTVHHETFTLCCTDGRLSRQRWRYRGRELSLQSDSTMLMEPGEYHQTLEIGQPTSFHVICLDPSWMHELIGSGTRIGHMHFREGQVDHPSLALALRQLWRVLREGGDELESQEQLCTCLSSVGALALERFPDSRCRGPDRALRRVRDYLIDTSSSNIPLQTLSAVAQLSACYLVRSFKRRYGLSPHQFRIAVRVARARELIGRGCRLPEVAMLAGFSDQAHLSRIFKRTLGLSPSDYRLTVMSR